MQCGRKQSNKNQITCFPRRQNGCHEWRNRGRGLGSGPQFITANWRMLSRLKKHQKILCIKEMKRKEESFSRVCSLSFSFSRSSGLLFYFPGFGFCVQWIFATLIGQRSRHHPETAKSRGCKNCANGANITLDRTDRIVPSD